MKIFITGAAGYIGGMLADLFLEDPKIEKIIALDLKDASNRFPQNSPRFSWITYNLGDEGWQKKVLKEGKIDAIIHCAYIIRQPYSKKDRAWQIKSNITAADNVFQFAFKNSIKKLIHFSTVACYGSRPENTLEYWFKEEDPLKEEKYLYGVDKKIIEENLRKIFEEEKNQKNALPAVTVIRPCAVTGPRGQFMFKRFGLIQMVKEGLPIIPITGKKAARQYIHEDDLATIIKMVIYNDIGDKYEVFNTAPSCYLLLKEMAQIIGKKSIRIPKWLGKLGFAFLWHITRGKAPTVPVGINSYTYPIIVDGSKITKFGFKYQYNCVEALKAEKGYYSKPR